jgi:DNA-binding transcriptional ArsR family regulator
MVTRKYIQPDAITAILAELLTMKMEHKEHFFTELLVKVCTLTNPLDYSQLFTEQETADRLRYSIPTLYRLRKQGKIHYRKDGNNIRYSLGDIVEYEENCKR